MNQKKITLVCRDWEETGESEAEFYRRALGEILAWKDLAIDSSAWAGNLHYGLAKCVGTAESALMGLEFNTEIQIARLHASVAEGDTPAV